MNVAWCGALVALLVSACGEEHNGPSEAQAGGGGEAAEAAVEGGSGGSLPSTGGEGGLPSGDGGGDTLGGSDSGAGGELTATAGAGGGTQECAQSASCAIAAEFLCDEWSNACPAYIAETEGSCDNRGGVWASPAACPTAAFEGKCALPASPDASQLTSRWYTGADTATQESFCTTIGQGTWSTTF